MYKGTKKVGGRGQFKERRKLNLDATVNVTLNFYAALCPCVPECPAKVATPSKENRGKDELTQKFTGLMLQQ